MKISVIIPTYKPQHYLLECLDSLCNQSLCRQDFEIVIVLNGCNEPYYSQIYEYIQKNENHSIALYQTDSPGVSNARNIGIDKSNGEYITFIDDDDIVSLRFLEELITVSSPDCVGCASMKAFYNNIEENLPTFLDIAYKRCKDKDFNYYEYRQFLSPPVCKLIHKEIIGKTRFPIDMKKSEDSVFCMQISPNINNMKLASYDAIYYQRLREGSASRRKESTLEIIKEHLFIEYKYFSIWIKNPFQYNFKFFLSRIVACGRNCLHYIMCQKMIKYQ